ncbi:MAG: hypothetical protein JWL97_4350 [Gemmatimonadales bacterium]|nr:hypothetical protein [Gemmatimonadales bacterium]
MAEPKKQNAPEGVRVDLAGGLDLTPKSNTDSPILANKSTATEVQLAKVLALLRQGPKTTIELRHHAIMMPAARVFQLKREHDCTITTELVALYDDQGVRHRKCARYHLIERQPAQASLDLQVPV